MLHSPDAVRRFVRLYARAIRLYPCTFRDEFGEPMRVAFEQWIEDEAARRKTKGVVRVCLASLAELVPTLLREHLDASTSSGAAAAAVAKRAARLLAACAVPLLAFAAMRPLATRPEEQVVLAACVGLMAAGMARARGRGWACSRNAVLAAAVGVGLPLCWEAMSRPTTPSALWVAPLLIVAAATIGLIVSTGVRLAVEGITLAWPVTTE